jgi:hypothetical protein
MKKTGKIPNFHSQISQISIAFSKLCNPIFSLSEVDSESLSTLRSIVFKREASRVEGYVTPCCPEMRLKCQKSEQVWEKLRNIWGKVEKYLGKS